MTKIFTKKMILWYEDYAHHPTEIASILSAFKNVDQKRKIISIFEPHRYSSIIIKKRMQVLLRTRNSLLVRFTLQEKKRILNLMQLTCKINSRFSKTQVIIIKDYNEIEKYLKKNLTSNEIIIGMGAGSISNI